jgi:hypothetical protein
MFVRSFALSPFRQGQHVREDRMVRDKSRRISFSELVSESHNLAAYTTKVFKF